MAWPGHIVKCMEISYIFSGLFQLFHKLFTAHLVTIEVSARTFIVSVYFKERYRSELFSFLKYVSIRLDCGLFT